MDCLLYDSHVLLETIKKKQTIWATGPNREIFFLPGERCWFEGNVFQVTQTLWLRHQVHVVTDMTEALWYQHPSLEKTLIHWNRQTVQSIQWGLCWFRAFFHITRKKNLDEFSAHLNVLKIYRFICFLFTLVCGCTAMWLKYSQVQEHVTVIVSRAVKDCHGWL